MKNQWYLYKDGRQLGPLKWEELWQEAKQGNIAPDDLVWKQGLEDWLSADQIHGLVNIPDFVVTAPPPPKKITAGPGGLKVPRPVSAAAQKNQRIIKNQPYSGKPNQKAFFAILAAGLVLLIITAGLIYYFLFSILLPYFLP